MKRKESFFMLDSSSSDKKEVVIDFFLSWTLRCACKGLEIYNNERLEYYCKKILSVLLFGNVEKIKGYNIKSIKTWKQWSQIDLCAEIILKEVGTGIEKKYALLMENKVYTTIHSNQLAKYKDLFESEYKDGEFSLQYVFFTCKDAVSTEEQKCCEKSGYRAYCMDDIIEKALNNEELELTGNPLFDEFWLSNWG